MAANKIYVDAGRPATLHCGEHAVHCFTLQEAKLAWDRLSAAQKKIAVIKVAGGELYAESEIRRLQYAK
jgi:hypothetical protein